MELVIEGNTFGILGLVIRAKGILNTVKHICKCYIFNLLNYISLY